MPKLSRTTMILAGILVAGSTSILLTRYAFEQVPGQATADSAVRPPGAYLFKPSRDTREQRDAFLQRVQAERDRKTPTEVAPLEAQKITPIQSQRR